MTSLELKSLSSEDFESAVAELAKASQGPAQQVCLDWSEIGDIEPTVGLAYAAQLLALQPDRVTVHVPADSEKVSALVQSGLAFALRRTRAEVTPADSLLHDERWGRSWSPGNRAPWRLMFNDEDAIAGTELFGALHATFVNPHWVPPRSGSDHVAHLVGRWTALRTPFVPALAGDVAYAVSELLDNIREHAVGYPQQHMLSSLLHTHIDHGASPHLHLAVMDTGPGIARTVRAKSSHASQYPEDAALVAALVEGKVSGWGRARGFGLTRLSERVQERGAQLSIMTQTARLDQREATIKVREGSEISGTVLVISFPLAAE